LDGLRALPGVRHATVAALLPFSGEGNANVLFIDGQAPKPGEKFPAPAWNYVDPAYFAAMGIPILRGRALAASDTENTTPVAVIDDLFARKHLPSRDPVGAKVQREPGSSKPLVMIVCLTGNTRLYDLAEENPTGQIYFHYRQFPQRSMNLVVKTTNDQPELAAAIRRQIQRLDPELPLFDVKSMPDRLAESLLNRRAMMIVCAVFAVLALGLSAIGLYGVLAYTVAQRTREFGIRLALGATGRQILAIVLRRGLTLALLGLAIGIAAAAFLMRLMTTVLYRIRPMEPGVVLLVAGVLAAVAVVATLVPSVRATRVEPSVALRHE
ncbi:MAG: FtsX-like permease family protein, partial [Bryobacteraceae bacterium]